MEKPILNPFYVAVRKGEQSLRKGKGVPYTPELEDEIWNEGLVRAEAGHKPTPEVIPQ